VSNLLELDPASGSLLGCYQIFCWSLLNSDAHDRPKVIEQPVEERIE